MVAGRQNIFRDNVFFVETQVMSNGPDKAPVEDAAGKLIPLFIFDGLKKTSGDARRGRNLIERHAAHFALALQIVAKSPFGHFFPRLDGLSEYRAAAEGCQSRRRRAAIPA